MKFRGYIAVFCLIILAISIFIVSCTKQEIKGNVPMFKGKNLLDDKEISMADLKGYVLIIDFWATWCAPCIKEIPGFIELQDKYKDKKFAVIGMSLDQGGEKLVKNFMSDKNINYPIIMAGKDILAGFEAVKGSRIQAIPITFVVDREGNIVSTHEGYRGKDVFEKEIQALLE